MLHSLFGKSYSVCVQRLDPKKSAKTYPVFVQVLSFGWVRPQGSYPNKVALHESELYRPAFLTLLTLT